MEEYGIKRVMVYALTLLAMGAGLSGWMKTTWAFSLLWGLIIGIGTGFTSAVLGVVITNRWFKERKGLVMGILTSSTATGQLVFLPLV
ncbi:MFS transporter [Effusibacillus dendaii]|uniref:Major facilitator superfamily (MFS) profile domain-containing protein n=1 Tax=Effusibacillus dendaii TaxID=2743772 RepID=A0A7I8DAF3_9BACL|nr:hypothetical protein [Effusibacillus dendaii]BCJ85939.1 hypothetical protein skT53_09240 [Effusibacillus dendaii]